MFEDTMSEHIDWLIKKDHKIDVLNMLLGENEYADPEAFEKLDVHSLHLRRMAIRHLEFLVNFGFKKETQKQDGKLYSTYPEYFNAWKLAGCPGISLALLEQLRIDKTENFLSNDKKI